MNIEKLQMCRLCLVEDVRMFNVTNKDLQTLYEKLTDVPYVTEDSRPMLACVFCYTRLKQCCQLQRKCLEAEKMLTEMLNKDHVTKHHIKQGLIEFVIAPTETIDIINEFQSRSNDIKEELPDDCEEHNDINEIKEEHQTEFEYQDSCPDLEDMTTNHSESDSEDDTPVMEFKIEEETDVSENKRRAEETQSAPDALRKELYVKITRLEDTTTAHHKKTERNTQIRTTTACSKSFKVNNTAIATKKGKQQYECDVCQRSYTIKSKLINHIRKHSVEKPYKCDICRKSFNLKQNFKVHCRLHTGEKPFECGICHKSFTQSNQLKKHNRIHTGVKPYKCEICRKGFSRKQDCKVHQQKHSGVKPYKCDTCQKSFFELKRLNEHNRIHSGEKPYKCDICHSNFAHSYTLYIHIRTHTGEKPYKCEICQKSFSRSQVFKEHFRKHSGEKPYKCETCQRSFAYRKGLNIHVRTHTGEKPYKCEKCHRGFAQRSTLNIHVRTHSGEKSDKCEISA